MTKAEADIEEWCKEVAPSTELRKWYAHDPGRFEEFARRYRAELIEPACAKTIEHLRCLMAQKPLTLLTATKQAEISGASVLAAFLANEHRPPNL